MQERPFKVNSQLLPEGFPREFDAQIYFKASGRAFASELREKAIAAFAGQRVFTGEMIPVAIGPHPVPLKYDVF
jgi:DOPA 4,5-dioxygenase